MLKIKLHIISCLAGVMLNMVLISPASAQIQYANSSLGRYQAYITPWYSSTGVKIGIQVHYSIGALQDQSGQPSHYSAVCVGAGQSWQAPCLRQDAKVWTRINYYNSVGSWVTQNIPISCSGFATVQVHQPYVKSFSDLNFSVSGGSPYQGGQLFYHGSSDTAKLQIQGCEQVYT